MAGLVTRSDLGIHLDFAFALDTDPKILEKEALAARQTLETGEGPGNDFLGWVDLPQMVQSDILAKVESAAATIRKAEALVVVGIGGSYLGSRSVIEALTRPFEPGFEVLFAGHQLDADYHGALMRHLQGKRYAVNVISKSGTTTEPAVGFRLLMADLTRRFPKDLRDLVFVTTDAARGKLRPLAKEKDLMSFVVPDDVGGRFSVLSPVGLLPIAAAGFDIRALLEGARQMANIVRDPARATVETNPALAYAAWRNQAYRSGKKVEVMAAYTPRLIQLGEWWKQLYGESEGKGGKALLPASVCLTTDLHSLGQYMQDGERMLIETVLDVVAAEPLEVPKASGWDDGMGHLTGRDLHAVNRTVTQAALAAHAEGGVSCLRLEVPTLDEKTVGALLYFFEYACGVSAYMLGVNPFDQPGVEAYKRNMKKLLG
jgi:glucose-6-phosphate isomerase